MFERGNIGQELVENIGGLLIGIFTAKLDLQMPQFGGRAIRKKARDRRGRIRLPAAALFIAGRMNTQMAKNCIDLAAPMVFDRAETVATATGSRLRNEGLDLIIGNFRLNLADQRLAIVVREAKVNLRPDSGRSMCPTTRDSKIPASSMRSKFKAHFIRNSAMICIPKIPDFP